MTADEVEAAAGRFLGRSPALVAQLADDIPRGNWLLGSWVAGSGSHIDEAEAALARLCQGARTLLFFADGVPALCGQMMAQLAGWNIPGSADPSQQRRPRTRFFDSADPHTLAGALTADRLATTRFVFLEQSCGHIVAAQASAVLAALEAAGLADLHQRIACAATERGALWTLLRTRVPDLRLISWGAGSADGCLMTPGLMPALARGLDARAIRHAALSQWAHLSAAPAQSPITPEAARVAALIAHGSIAGLVVRPFADRLGRLGDWLAAVWSEVLQRHAPGISAHALAGSLPLQGRTSGPALVLHLTLDPEAAGQTPIGRIGAEAQAGTIALATMEARQQGHLVRTIHIPRLDEATIGGLLMQLLLEAILCRRLLEASR